MARRKISQREAHATHRELDALKRQIDAQRNRWASEYPGATFVTSFPAVSDFGHGAFMTTNRLGYALVAKYNEDKRVLNVYAARVS